MTDLNALADRVEAEAPSKILQRDVLFAFGWTIKSFDSRLYKVPHDWITPDGKGVVAYGEQPSPLTSLDAAVRLVPEGCHWAVMTGYEGPNITSASISWRKKAGEWGEAKCFKAPIPAQALTAASLRARAAMEKKNG